MDRDQQGSIRVAQIKRRIEEEVNDICKEYIKSPKQIAKEIEKIDGVAQVKIADSTIEVDVKLPPPVTVKYNIVRE